MRSGGTPPRRIPSPRTSSSCRRTCAVSRGSPTSRPTRGPAPTSRCTSSDRRCSAQDWRPPSVFLYAFASHFAPTALHEAIALYRRDFKPSEQLDKPYLMAAFNVIAADDQADAEREQLEVLRNRVALLLRPGTEYTDEQADQVLASPQGEHLRQMTTYSAAGTPDVVLKLVTEFAEHTGVDELIVTHQSPQVESRLRSAQLFAEAYLT